MIAAVKLMESLFTQHGYFIPKLRVSCGWPSSGGLGQKRKTLGQCWPASAAADKLPQIFISPWLEAKSNIGVLPTLVHEVVHAVVGNDQKHNKVFRKCALAVGLEGKMTSTIASPVLMEVIEGWQVRELGPYPHGKLDPRKSPVAKQTTRMIKMECPDCEFVARTSQKWLDMYGPVQCPGCKTLTKVE